MMPNAVTPAEIYIQSESKNPLDTEPALIAGGAVGLVGAVASILVIGGWIDQSQKEQLEQSVGVIIPAALLIVPILTSVLTRIKAYSPRSAAKIAVVNANHRVGEPPTLSTLSTRQRVI